MRGAALALAVLAALTAGSSAGTVVSVDVTVIMDGREIESVPGFFDAKGALQSLDGGRFSRALAPYLLAAGRAALQSRIDAEGRLTPESIRACGVGFVYDPARLAARVEVRGVDRPLTTLDLASRLGADAPDPVRPAALSGYLNLLGGGEYREDAPASGAPAWRPPVLDLDGAVRAQGTVLEGVETYRGQSPVHWQRQQTRLVYDLPERRVRTTAGDVEYDIRDFQLLVNMGGVSMARNQDLQRQRSNAPAGEKVLLIERYSRVDVWINGQRDRTMQLAPGRYDIRNFPFALGTNDIELRVTDEVGRVEVVRFPFVFDSALLAVGEQDFSYTAGFVSQLGPAGRTYDVQNPMFSAFHEVGLTDQLTARVTTQGMQTQSMWGAETRWATSFGTVRVDAATNERSRSVSGTAGRLQYRYADTVARGFHQAWTAIATYRSATYRPVGDEAATNPYILQLGLQYNRVLAWGVLGAFGWTRQIGRPGFADGETEDLTLSRYFHGGVQATAVLGRSWSAAAGADERIRLAVQWNFSANDSVTASHDSEGGKNDLQWHHSATRRVRAVDSSVIVTQDRTSQSGQAEASYRDYRFNASAQASAARGRVGDASVARGGSLNLGTAVAFADGRAALTRPITDSFVMVAPGPNLDGKPVEVNASGGVPEARSGPLGPAVLPEVLSYQEQRVVLSAPDLPPWADLGPQPLSVMPAYRSGARLVAGGKATIALQGSFVDGKGRPLPLEAGDVESLDAPGTLPQGFFTGASGRFMVEGLAPGRLRLTLRNYPGQPVLLSAPAGRARLVDVGALTIAVP